MLSTLSSIFSKSSQRLLNSYSVDSNNTHKIIQKLFELDAVDELLSISEIDPKVRDSIILKLLQEHKLEILHLEYILQWLEPSKMQSHILTYLKNRVEKKHIEKLVKNTYLDENARRGLKSILTNQQKPIENPNELYTTDEKYLKLKMIYAESKEIYAEEDKNLYFDTVELNEIVLKFLSNYQAKSPNREEFLINFINENYLLEPPNKESLLTILGFLDMSLDEKISLIEHLQSDYFYEPDFFFCFTNFQFGDVEKMQNILSRPIVNKWIDTYFKNSYYHDLIWLSHFYPGFEWVEPFVKERFDAKIVDNLYFNENSHLTKKLNLTLFEMITESIILDNLEKSSRSLHDLIDSRLEHANFEIDYYLKALSMIGGKVNFEYLAKQTKKKPVENVQVAQLEVERKYLKLKKNANTAEQIQKLVEEEENDKQKIIYAYYYSSFMKVWIENISMLKYVSDDLRKLLTVNIPDLKGFAADSDLESKIMICKLIALLKIEDQRSILEEFVKSKKTSLAIQAILSLKSLGDDISIYIQDLAYSNDVLVRQELARSLHLFRDDYDEITIVKMALDNNALVSEYTMNFIASLNQDFCLRIFTEIHQKIQLKNRYHMIQIFSQLNTIKVIPIIIELLKNGDNNLYLEGIKAFANIDHPLSIYILSNIELDKNFVLELERTKALINLGNFNAWINLTKYFTINHTMVQQYAKILYIQLAGLEQIKTVLMLCKDQNALVAGFAIVKLYLYNEIAANEIIDDLFESQAYNKLYYLSVFFSLLPYNEVKDKIKILYNSNSLKCKTIATIIMAKNDELNLIDQLEKNTLSMDDPEHKEIVLALNDYPDKIAYNLIKTISSFQNSQNIGIALKALDKIYHEDNNSFIQNLWNKGDNDTKIHIVDYIIRSNNEVLYEFIKVQIDYVSFDVQAHIYRAIITIENSDNAWAALDELIRADEIDIKRSAIEALSMIEDQKTINILNKYLSSPSEEVLIEVIKALGFTGNPEVMNLLSKYTESSSPRLKIALATALGNLPFKDSLKILKKLSIDRDEYVKVTADVSIEKLQRGIDIPIKPFIEMIDDMLEENTWKLTNDWFSREYTLFLTKYSKYELKSIDTFVKKTILEQDDYTSYVEDLKKELDKELKASSDTQNIVKLKEDYEKNLEKIMPKNELIIALLLNDLEKVTKMEYNIIKAVIKSKDPILTKALVLNICKSQTSNKSELIRLIISVKENEILNDFIIYCTSQSKEFSHMQILSELIYNDRARFYLIYLFSYYCVNFKWVDKTILKSVFNTLSKSSVDDLIKSNIISIIKQLERMS